ncbi:hypothetical protein IW248_002929 [Micromonospora ureilytica]|uniref:DUF222 domain-containing protein n=1 Tax=Micromonospora ureilytica TaxID=709868 RepID=A0ABS0JHV4_9ACTN|nr:hypothetical protein [Micromonospora ureilytica]
MLEALAQAEAAVAGCVDASAWALPEQDLVAALDAAHRLEQRLAMVKLALVRELDGRGIATAQGASSTAVWLRDRLRLGVGAARRLVELAATLDAAPAGVRDALAGGAVDVEQVRVIAETISTVHTAAGAEAAEKAVGVLVEWPGSSSRPCCASWAPGSSTTSPPRSPMPPPRRRWRPKPAEPAETAM